MHVLWSLCGTVTQYLFMGVFIIIVVAVIIIVSTGWHVDASLQNFHILPVISIC